MKLHTWYHLAVNAAPEMVMSFGNYLVPMSMFTEEGVLCVVDKSEFMHKPEALVSGNKIPSVPSADII